MSSGARPSRSIFHRHRHTPTQTTANNVNSPQNINEEVSINDNFISTLANNVTSSITPTTTNDGVTSGTGAPPVISSRPKKKYGDLGQNKGFLPLDPRKHSGQYRKISGSSEFSTSNTFGEEQFNNLTRRSISTSSSINNLTSGKKRSNDDSFEMFGFQMMRDNNNDDKAIEKLDPDLVIFNNGKLLRESKISSIHHAEVTSTFVFNQIYNEKKRYRLNNNVNNKNLKLKMGFEELEPNLNLADLKTNNVFINHNVNKDIPLNDIILSIPGFDKETLSKDFSKFEEAIKNKPDELDQEVHNDYNRSFKLNKKKSGSVTNSINNRKKYNTGDNVVDKEKILPITDYSISRENYAYNYRMKSFKKLKNKFNYSYDFLNTISSATTAEVEEFLELDNLFCEDLFRLKEEKDLKITDDEKLLIESDDYEEDEREMKDRILLKLTEKVNRLSEDNWMY